MRVRSNTAFQASLLLAISLLAHTATGQTTVTTLDHLRNQARPLLIFAPKPEDAQLGIQLRMLHEHAAEASDRQIVPIALPFDSPSPTPLALSGEEAVAARRHFDVAPDQFIVILIGKDGGAKLRSAKPISMSQLNEIIDAMPMRQDEMRQKP